MMVQTFFELGPVGFVLDTNETDIISSFRQMFDSSSESLRSFGLFGIRRVDTWRNRTDVRYSNTYDQIFDLSDGVRYMYDKSRLTYDVSVGEVAIGSVNLSSQRADWMVKSDFLPRTAFHFFVLDPLSLSLPKHRYVVCHGAAVTHKHGSAVLFGMSGAGKSTLAFLLSHAITTDRFRTLTDDTLLLDGTGCEIRVWSIASGFGLTAEILNMCDVGVSEENVLQFSRGKIYLRSLPRQATVDSSSIRELVFLERREGQTGGTRVEELTYVQTLRQLIASQTSITTPYAQEKLEIWGQLARDARGLLVSFDRFCDVTTLANALAD